MTRLGILVGEDNWTFFKEIFADLSAHYVTDVYRRKAYAFPVLQGRMNRWLYRQGVGKMLRRNDVCFFEWAGELLVSASHLPKQSAIITRLHSFELYDWAPRINWNHVDKVILVSEAMRRHFVKLYPEHSAKTVVTYNGRPLEKFTCVQRPPFAFNLGMLCSINPIKRVYEVILMLFDLRQQGYDARLHIAGTPSGDPRYGVAIHQLVERLGLQNCVIFDGYVVDTPTWFEKVDIFISNSFWEGQQVALIEAMAAGCYCLSHAWNGAEEMLPSENLFITNAELGRKILAYSRWCNDERRRCQAQLRALASEKFDIGRTTTEIRQVVQQVVS
jgi:glycosyltransferase involved in cell wall biosynthesis